MEKIQASVCDGAIVVNMPIDILIYACENNPAGGYKVPDKAAFARWIAASIVEFDEDEAGDTALYRLLDRLFEEAAVEGVIG